MQALRATLHFCPIEVSSNECVLIVNGGTPESVVASIVVGFKNVLYVAGDDNEFDMMQIPNIAEEREYKLDYYAYPGNQIRS